MSAAFFVWFSIALWQAVTRTRWSAQLFPKLVFLWFFLIFGPSAITNLLTMPHTLWLWQQHFPASSLADRRDHWKAVERNGEWVCLHEPTGQIYLAGQSTRAIHDRCQLDEASFKQYGVMRVSRGEGYQFVTVRGILNPTAYAAVGEVSSFWPPEKWWQILFGIRRWQLLALGGDRLSVACTNEQCGLLTGSRLDHFLTLYADRITNSNQLVRLIAFHRPDGWYVLDTTNFNSIRGPWPPRSLGLENDRLFELRDGKWAALDSNPSGTSSQPQVLEDVPVVAFAKGLSEDIVLGIGPTL